MKFLVAHSTPPVNSAKHFKRFFIASHALPWLSSLELTKTNMWGDIVNVEMLNWEKYQLEGTRKVKSPTWLRLENKIYLSPIWDALNDSEFRVFIFLLAFKSQKNNLCNVVEINLRVISRVSGCKESVILQTIEKLEECGIVRKLPETSGNFRKNPAYSTVQNSTVQDSTEQNRTGQNEAHTGHFAQVALLPSPSCEPIEEKEKPKGDAKPKAPCLQTLWNERCGSLPQCSKATPKRLALWKSRWLERPDLAYWQMIVAKIAASPFHRGELPGKAWVATVDYLLRPDTHVKVVEMVGLKQGHLQPVDF